MRAFDVMTCEDVWACQDNSQAQDVAMMMAEHRVGAIPVLDGEGRLEGIVTDRDLCCRLVARGKNCRTPICDIMSTSVQWVHADADIHEVESLMSRHKIRRMPVVDDDNRLQGVISLSDIAKCCDDPTEEHEVVATIDYICSP